MEFFPHGMGDMLQNIDCHGGIFRVEQLFELERTGIQSSSQDIRCDMFLTHDIGQLHGQQTLTGLGRNLFQDTVFFQKIIEVAAGMWVHGSLYLIVPLILARARQFEFLAWRFL